MVLFAGNGVKVAKTNMQGYVLSVLDAKLDERMEIWISAGLPALQIKIVLFILGGRVMLAIAC